MSLKGACKIKQPRGWVGERKRSRVVQILGHDPAGEGGVGLLVVHVGVSVDVVGGDETATTRLATLVNLRILTE